jgi:hypothetical protein
MTEGLWKLLNFWEILGKKAFGKFLGKLLPPNYIIRVSKSNRVQLSKKGNLREFPGLSDLP